MKLRKPCEEHGKYDAHKYLRKVRNLLTGDDYRTWAQCPGGVFLPDDTLERIIEVLRAQWDKPPYYPWKDLPEKHREHLIDEARQVAAAILEALEGDPVLDRNQLGMW